MSIILSRRRLFINLWRPMIFDQYSGYHYDVEQNSQMVFSFEWKLSRWKYKGHKCTLMSYSNCEKWYLTIENCLIWELTRYSKQIITLQIWQKTHFQMNKLSSCSQLKPILILDFFSPAKENEAGWDNWTYFPYLSPVLSLRREREVRVSYRRIFRVVRNLF